MSGNIEFDRWYAAQKVKVLVSPSHKLETFGNTIVEYRMISELDDFPNKIRVREGRLEAYKPRVITPHEIGVSMEGFSDEAKEYFEFLSSIDENYRILRYGYSLKSDNFSEVVLTDTIDAVAERVVREVRSKGEKFSAVLTGVDEPWDIALVEFWRREVWRSAGSNIRELQIKGKLF